MIDTVKQEITTSDKKRIVLASVVSVILYIAFGILLGKITPTLHLSSSAFGDMLLTAILVFIIPIPFAALFAFFVGYKLTGKKVCGVITIVFGIALTILLLLALNVLLPVYAVLEALFV